MTDLDRIIAAWRKNGTPGPWKADFGEAFHIRENDRSSLAQMRFLHGFGDIKGRRNVDSVANTARLIASAPAMADEIDRLRKLDEEYGRVEAAIIMSCPSFDGDSDHKNCGDRLIVAVEGLAARIAELDEKLAKARDDALEEAACLCERTEMGIGTKAGGEYTAGPSVCFELGSGTHPGMGYAALLRTIKERKNDG